MQNRQSIGTYELRLELIEGRSGRLTSLFAVRRNAISHTTAQFLNRMGHGDVPKWLKALDLAKYQSQAISKRKVFARPFIWPSVVRLMPASAGCYRKNGGLALERISIDFRAIQDMADKIVPDAIKELNAKLSDDEYAKAVRHDGRYDAPQDFLAASTPDQFLALEAQARCICDLRERIRERGEDLARR
ncbi:hypothetical protein [Burkholderia ubonensis]|uniref:hypothetical protein n=1 Tax=Burkholderia ubonensis TaxID=101571 RepID=UPI001E33B9B5|nr:hypothetical protein [Burkholderia ubonensis]